MATSSASRVPAKPVGISSALSTLKAYFIPLILFSASLFYQLIVIPRAFPRSHYDVLGIKQYSSIDEVNQAYEKLSSKRESGVEAPSTLDFIKVRYAFELLTNEIWKRDYDLFSIDEQIHVIEKAKEQYDGRSISEISFPLLETISFDPKDNVLDVISSKNFLSKLETDKALLIQIFSPGSARCAQFSNKWKRIVTLLDGVANTGVIDLWDVKLTTHLAEKKAGGLPFFRHGVPALVAFPPGCRDLSCIRRYEGDLSIDSVTDWVATSILSLPRIRYYSKESMAQDFLLKSKPHKVKVIFFSQTGERATPFIRQAAKNYSAYATFAFLLWQEEESSLWWNMLGVESAPAIVFLKEAGVKPVVYNGYVNSSNFLDIMEKNKHQVLPQLRHVTSKELGCDSRGFSLAGKDTKVWYCVVLAGRQSRELNEMRETMRRVQDTLSSDGESTAEDQDPSCAPALLALKQKRLAFTWLDGEAQKSYCFFYINSENSYDTCGPRRDITDVVQMFIVRYERNATEDVEKKQPTNRYSSLYNVEADPASQLVAKYNGSNQIEEIIRWVSEIIKDGDSKNLPSFRTKTPELVPEDADSSWSAVSPSGGLKHRIGSFINGVHDYSGDPRVGPILLLAALISFGSVWLRRSQVAQPQLSRKPNEPEQLNQRTEEPDQSRQPKEKDATIRNRRNRPRNDLVPPSMTDVEPKDAKQVEFSDSD